MTLLLILLVMTAAAVCAVIWPLTRNCENRRSGSDIAVYRDQLDEVERDLAAGLVGKVEAEAARVEISRRLLAAADGAPDTVRTSSVTSVAWGRRIATVAALLVLPTLVGGLYLWLGSPQLASMQQEAASHGVAASQSVEQLVAQAEAHLQRNPKDGRGWEILAPVYMRLGRYSDSVTAWRDTLQLLGESAERDANLGESLTAEANGVVTADARAAFVRALTLDKALVGARYYLGLAAEQDGDRDTAAKVWQDLIAEAPAGAEWVAHVRDALTRVESNAFSPPGPSPAQIAAAAKEPPEQQSAMIQSMVERLAARLKQDGSDVDGWVRLVRSYKVLGQPDKARAAIADARQVLAGDRDKLEKLDAALKSLAADQAPVSELGTAQTMTGTNEAPEQQSAMIQSMVERLAVRLKQDGSDVDGWVRLVHSYRVLGDAAKALAASMDARHALAVEPAKLQHFIRAIEELDENKAASATQSPLLDRPGAPEDHGGVENMIERLADRLQASGSDPAGWLMLVRSYRAINENDKATAAISDARQVLASDPSKLEWFNSSLQRLNISE